MAATAASAPPHPRLGLKPDRFDRILSAAALVLLAFVLAALWRGRSEWGGLPAVLWGHISTIVLAVALTPVMLLRPRGDRLHRRLGWLWASAMALTALLSFAIRGIDQGSFSFIHLLSAWTLVQVPLIVRSARVRDHRRHRNAVRAMVAGALIVAGFFTFPFDRLMGRWLFG